MIVCVCPDAQAPPPAYVRTVRPQVVLKSRGRLWVTCWPKWTPECRRIKR